MDKMSEFYEPSDFKDCPACGNKIKDPLHKDCWHCSDIDCGCATCAYLKHQIDELIYNRTGFLSLGDYNKSLEYKAKK